MLDKKPTRLKLICGLGVFFGLFVCLIPTILPRFNDKSSRDDDVQIDKVSRVIWPIIFMLGSVSNKFISIWCSGYLAWFQSGRTCVPFRLPVRLNLLGFSPILKSAEGGQAGIKTR